MNNPKLKICNKSPHENPTYAKPGDSGMDLRAWIELTEDEKYLNKEFNYNITPSITLKPLERTLVHTGIYLEIPEGYEVQVRPKSGQALKKGITVLNSPGTVDVNFRGEICVIAINLSNDNITIEDGEKIAQMVLCPVQHEGLVDVEMVDEISINTERGAGGFGHTGIN
jgi:dUTP pyrophosphatase